MVSVTSIQPRFKYRPQGRVLSAFGQSRAFMQVIRGPLGSGKTKCCVSKIIKLCAEQQPDKSGIRRSRYAAVRNTYPELVSTTIAEFREMVSPAMGKITMSHPPQCDLDFMLPDGTRVQAEIVFIALDREEDIRKLRGLQLTGVYFNELRFIPLAIVREGLSRCDRYPQPGWSPWVGGISDTNAWDEDHPLEEMMAYFSDAAEIEDENLRTAFEQMKTLGAWEFFNQPGAVVRAPEGTKGAYRSLDGGWWMVNPDAENLSVLSPTYYARQIAGAKTDWIRVNLGNETGLAIDGKPVHPEYQDSVHRSNKPLLPIPGRVIRVGMDFGLTPAAVFWQQHPSGRWHGIDELVCFDLGAEKFADALKRKVAEIRDMLPSKGTNLEFVFRGDPSGDNRSATDERTYFDVLRANGIPALPASTNDTAIRRDAFTRPLTRLVDGGPGILLSPRCKMLRKALKGAWSYRRVKVAGSDRFKDEAEKNEFSHVGEAGEYGLMDAGEHAVINSSQAKHFPRGPVTPRVPAGGRDWLDLGW